MLIPAMENNIEERTFAVLGIRMDISGWTQKASLRRQHLNTSTLQEQGKNERNSKEKINARLPVALREASGPDSLVFPLNQEITVTESCPPKKEVTRPAEPGLSKLKW